MDRAYLPQLAIFAAVANLRGFRSASASLRLSPSAVSHAISELEAKLECRLFQRCTRSLSLTEAGARLLERLGPALGEIELAARDASEIDVRPRGRVRITAQYLSAEHLLAPHLASFLSAHPEISLEITTDDRFVDIVAEGYDAGLRLGENLEPDMIATRIGGQLRLILIAAPSYLEKYGAPRSLEDLTKHKCLRRRFSSGRIYDWEFERGGEAVVLHDLPATITSTTTGSCSTQRSMAWASPICSNPESPAIWPRAGSPLSCRNIPRRFPAFFYIIRAASRCGPRFPPLSISSWRRFVAKNCATGGQEGSTV
jgi:DNA-binding transcriptional LysR family regulator